MQELVEIPGGFRETPPTVAGPQVPMSSFPATFRTTGLWRGGRSIEDLRPGHPGKNGGFSRCSFSFENGLVLVVAMLAVVITAVGIAPVIVVRIAAIVIAVVITAVAPGVIVIAIPRVGFGGGAQGHEDRGNAQEEGLSQHFC